ncbi:androgen-induced gene 1 protein isoform X2 [Cephus cinctus]|uniref:Androgen-induced gene 1 protein isoform X2 n=1 Tax=Cephus cinctus TaxID=211228 RepID=A0AAJ7FPG6_CEPCN|nr:androgen-induced gene 1 protein isoform X2 [Cephus cinctus]XP_015601867.1 androgen-induced gene 1 protein isoform X2 [Cephus cinctus]XP_015601868.1 androgen-induced gene 1 protein isoform X2 [Cephus cinctus]XP_015601869.1 androgen-induced gene 1 protein isoform X2 [Cephus cinctus]XP_024944003.1 androgen-induced gene 1 protein isoform X2 [Cephus cinctus]XP_024944004.1 androgen-induced gene 1 protein isoform X2 [Cephus cinctus]
MKEYLLYAFHVIAFLQFAFAVYYDYTYIVIPRSVAKMHSAYGGKFKFLTFLDAIIQVIFFLICILNDVAGTNKLNPKKRPLVRRLKDYIHASLAFPIAMFVGVTFWALMFVDRELVLPKALDLYFPWWLNHIMHTMIMVSTLLEMLVAPRQYPKRSRGLTGLLIFMLSYLVWMHVIYAKSGIWVYPVMEVLSWPLRIAFFLVLFALATVLYFVGEGIDNVFWGSANKSVGKPSKKRKSK